MNYKKKYSKNEKQINTNAIPDKSRKAETARSFSPTRATSNDVNIRIRFYMVHNAYFILFRDQVPQS